ncbi:MAG: response regulator [Rhodospirillales bacterium]|nr:response regulator [Rhodospirillales bacterium]
MIDDLPHILAVDDDKRLRELLHKFLSENGFLVTSAADAAEARAKLESICFDLIVLDLMMPGESGLEFAQSLRETNDIPILMLTAMSEPDDRISGLEKGADDYLAKPFEPRELLLRINNILKRLPQVPSGTDILSLGEVSFDLKREELKRGDEVIHLTETESALLKILAKSPDRILSRDILCKESGTESEGRSVDVQVTRLRRKIETDPRQPRYLQTIRGQGYRLRPD